jgi:hypothetical protein
MDTDHQKHTAYTLRSELGGPVTRVRNQRGSFGEDPDVLALAPGHYWVEARATNAGAVRVPVVICRGETTAVYLDGSTAPASSSADSAAWVRQADGRIVGWRAEASLK